MRTKALKRSLSLLIALMMVISSLPLQVLATEGADADHEVAEAVEIVSTKETIENISVEDDDLQALSEQPEEAPTETPVNAPAEGVDLQVLQEQMDAILMEYLGATVLTEEEVLDIVNTMYWSEMEDAVAKLEALEASVTLTDSEMAQLEASYAGAATFVCFYETLLLAMTPSVFAASGNHTPVEGVKVSVSGATDNSMSNGVVTVTAQGSAGGWLGIGAKTKTATITVYNESGSTATISFDWVGTTINKLQIDGTVRDSSGSFSKQLGVGGSITITVTTAKDNTVNTLQLKNFNCAVQVASVDATITFDSALGTVKVGGTAVESGHQVAVGTDGVELQAEPASGVTFLAWYDADTLQQLSADKTFTLVPGDKATINVAAAYTTSAGTAWFTIGDKWYSDLSTATAAAASGNTIVTACNGTLPAGNYTIPAGVTLLIPYNSDNTMYGETPGEASSYKKPTFYRVLKMADGAKISVNGAINVSGCHCIAMPNNGAPSGPVGCIEMAEGSSVTVNNGGKLYAWGYIVGDGTVEVVSGGTVYEDFQIRDWRGGKESVAMIGNSQKVFPVSQYYVQNIQVPLTLHSGATENLSTSVDVAIIGTKRPSVTFVGSSNGMFQLKSGKLVKDYNEQTDRLEFDLQGTVTMSNIQISLDIYTIDSQDYVLPINGNISINLKDGSNVTVGQNFALLPGVIMNIEKGATIDLNGKKVIAYGVGDWGGYCGASNNKLVQVLYAYPSLAARGESSLTDVKITVEGTVDASDGYLYTTASAKSIWGKEGGTVINKAGTETITYQRVQSTSYPEIGITSAELINGDGNPRETLNATYTYTNGVWTSDCVTHTEGALGTAKAATCTEDGLTAGKKCTVCAEVLEQQAVIPATGHTEGAAATCTTAQTCTVCGAELAPALGHTAGAAATCTTAQTCTVCGAEITAALGHTEVVDAAVAATCTETGLTEGKHCSVCNEVLVAQTVVGALGHTAAEAVVENNVDATCTADGSYESVVYCSVCSTELSRTPVTVDALGHTNAEAVVENNVDPDCVNDGSYDSVVYCSVCGEEQSRTPVTVDALGHTNAEAVVENNVDPDCVNDGSYDSVVYCFVCGEEQSRTPVTVDALGHTNADAVVENNVDATCEAAGSYDSVVYCTVCGEEVSRNTVTVDALGHDYDAVVTDPTCTAGGYTTYTCSTCGDSYVGANVDALGHTNADAVVENNVDATCEAAGSYDSVIYCTVCGEEVSRETVSVDALGHDYDEVVTDPTCTTGGYTTYTCATCGDTYTGNEIAATGEHNYVNGVCSVCQKEELFKLAGATVTMGNSLALNFVIDTAKLNGTGHYAIITREYNDDRADVSIRVDQGDWLVYSGKLYYFTFNNIAAKEMTDALHVIVYNSEGKQVTYEWHDSLRDYGMRLVKTGSAIDRRMAVDMLNYGAAAQDMFSYHLDDLADSQLTAEQKGYATSSVELNNILIKGNGYAGSTATMKERIQLNFVYYKSVVTTDMYAVATYTNHYGEQKSQRIEGSAFEEYNTSMWYVPITATVIADSRCPITLTIYDADDNVVSTTVDSVESYVYRIKHQHSVYELLMKFADSAHAKLHPNS